MLQNPSHSSMTIDSLDPHDHVSLLQGFWARLFSVQYLLPFGAMVDTPSNRSTSLDVLARCWTEYYITFRLWDCLNYLRFGCTNLTRFLI